MAKNKKVTLIAGALILVVLLGLAAVMLLNPKEEKEEDIYLPIFGREASEVTKIEVKNTEGEYEIVQTSPTSWEVPKLEGVDVSESTLNQAVKYAAELKADKLISDTLEGGEKYGADSIDAVVKVYFSDDQIGVIEIFTPLNDDTGYYFTVEGTTNIYHVGSSNPLKYFISDERELVNRVISPFSDSNSLDSLELVEITNKNGFFSIGLLEDNGFDGYGNMYHYRVSGDADGYLTGRFYYDDMPDLRDFTASSCYMVHPTEQDLEELGLKNPQSKLRMKSDAGDVTMLIGNGDNSGHYIMIEGNTAVLRLVTSAITWLDYDADDLLTPFVMAPTEEETSAVSVTVGGSTYDFAMDGETVSCNGSPVDAKLFKHAFQLFCSPSRDGLVSDEVSAETLASITYETAGGTHTISFAADGRKLAMTVDGVQKYTCRKAFLGALEQGINDLLAGKDVSYQW